MEVIVGLKDIHILAKLVEKGADGFIFGSLFSTKYNFSNEQLVLINDFCRKRGLKRYISIDTFISEEDYELLDKYINLLARLDVDGIYFADLGVIKVAKKYGFANRLIYDPVTLMANNNDIGFYINKGINVVLARELTLNELTEIIKKYPYQLDMQVFGRLRMSYSKRKFLTNYFKEINKDVDVVNKTSITLREESREYNLPIKETEYGTCIYTDYVLLMYDEFACIKNLLRRAIIDGEFVNDEVLFAAVRDAKHVTPENSEFMKFAFVQRYAKLHDFDTGYLYKKTTDKKIENE